MVYIGGELAAIFLTALRLPVLYELFEEVVAVGFRDAICVFEQAVDHVVSFTLIISEKRLLIVNLNVMRNWYGLHPTQCSFLYS